MPKNMAGRYRILPGIGLKACRIGDGIASISRFPETPQREGRWIDLIRHGLQFDIRSGKIRTLIFYFRSRNHWTFDGCTNKGIGFCSSIPDVLRAYGEPDRVGDTIVHFGAFSGARDVSLSYERRGIRFTFLDSQLAYACVYAPSEEPCAPRA